MYLLRHEHGARCTAVGPTPYNSGIDGYQVLYISAFSYVCTLIFRSHYTGARQGRSTAVVAYTAR